MNKLIAILALVLFAAQANAADKSIAERVNAQIDFATKIDKCYAPIVFEEGIKPSALAKVKAAAEKRGWKLGSQSERVINVEKRSCKRS